jgi:hypothetical protein
MCRAGASGEGYQDYGQERSYGGFHNWAYLVLVKHGGDVDLAVTGAGFQGSRIVTEKRGMHSGFRYHSLKAYGGNADASMLDCNWSCAPVFAAAIEQMSSTN